METFTIKISGKDLQMLRRIAKAQNRRFDDFVQLCFADGLTYMFCDEMLHVEKEPEDYTQEEQKQLELNADCLLYTSPSPRDSDSSRMPSSA